jgi:hypothetical protein
MEQPTNLAAAHEEEDGGHVVLLDDGLSAREAAQIHQMGLDSIGKVVADSKE